MKLKQNKNRQKKDESKTEKKKIRKTKKESTFFQIINKLKKKKIYNEQKWSD